MIAGKRTYEFKRPSPYEVAKSTYTLEQLSRPRGSYKETLQFFDRVLHKEIRDVISYMTKASND